MCLRQRNRHGFAQDQAVRRAKIVRHAFFAHFQAVDHVREMSQRSGSEQKNLRQRFPFGVPAAQATFLFLHHRGEHHGNERGNANRGSQDDRGADRIAFVRQSGRAAAAGFRRLENFADFGLREQRNITRDFSQRADQQAQRGGDFRETVAMRVPGNAGQLQFQIRRPVPRPRPGLCRRARRACLPRRRIAASRPPCARARCALGGDELRRAIRRLSGQASRGSLAAAMCGRRAAWIDAFRRRARAGWKIAQVRAAANRELRAIAGRGRYQSRPDWWRPSERSRQPCASDFATAAVSAFTSGIAKFPARAASRASTSSANRSAVHCATMGSTEVCRRDTRARQCSRQRGFEIEHALQPAAIREDFTHGIRA